MAVDFFLKLKGIEGESRDKKYENQIDVIAWNWGMSQSGNIHLGGGGGSGKVSVQDITITKWVDKASTAIIKHCSLGTHIDEGELIIRKAGGTAVEYVIIKLKEIIVTNWQTSGQADGQDRLMETISLNFAEFEMEYTPQDQKGAPKPKVSVAYNMAKNAEA